MADRVCIWCRKQVAFDSDDGVWFHSNTGRIQGADGEHDADLLESAPLSTVVIVTVLFAIVWVIVGGIIVGPCANRKDEIEAELVALREELAELANPDLAQNINEEIERLDEQWWRLARTC
jgi:hypothetical protein